MTLLVLRCADIQAVRRFYEALGLPFIEERHGEGPVHYSARVGDLVLELYPRGESDSRGARIGLRVPDVVAACAAVTDTLGKVLRLNADVPPRTAVLADPEGHKIELTEGDGV